MSARGGSVWKGLPQHVREAYKLPELMGDVMQK